MNNIPVANPKIGVDEAQAVYEVIMSGWVSMGPKVQHFEQLLADYAGSKYAVAMNNGTSTLHACLLALDIGERDEVIVPTLSYISSANTILYQNATPVFCDSDPDLFNATVEHVRAKISPRTKAIMTVDMKGLPVDYEAFAELSAETGIPIISDSAESFGALYKGKKIGTQALLHSFSFFANKNLTTGEGGVVLTDDAGLYEKLRIIRNQGQEGRYHHTLLGNNFRMTDVQAAIGIEQLKKLDKIIGEKAKIAKQYDEIFGVTGSVSSPKMPTYSCNPSWYLYSIKVDAKLRGELIEHLSCKGIETRLSFPPIHAQPLYRKLFDAKDSEFPGAMRAFDEFLDIPIWFGMSEKQVNTVSSEILAVIK
ncbi:DegT/DnrJ/EryC1/StrS family aminotransferase [Alphaproteobacteria bacterium]|nr:DegT/DnrJ/EryC1/StrS family aminotransferase [Alphaproteobacteria bacterium]